VNIITRSIKYASLVFDGQGNQTGRYLNGPGVDFVLAEEKVDGAILWALADNQGSVRDLVNESGAIERPIFLPLIDVSTGTTVNLGQDTVVTNPQLVGAKVTIAANSLFDKNGNAFNGILSITQVPSDLTPAALPKNIRPDLVVTIQPGDMVFNTPALLLVSRIFRHRFTVVFSVVSLNYKKKHGETTRFIWKSPDLIRLGTKFSKQTL
jgi:hypothetical protein